MAAFVVGATPTAHATASTWAGGAAPARSPRRPAARNVVHMIALTRDTEKGTEKRIVVTGTGVVSCFGSDSDHFYQCLLDGKSGVKKVTNFDVNGWSTDFAASIDKESIGAEGYVAPKILRRMDPFLTYALVAGKKALEDAGIGIDSDAFNKLDKTRSGVLCGSGMGGLNVYSEGVEKRLKGAKMSPFL